MHISQETVDTPNNEDFVFTFTFTSPKAGCSYCSKCGGEKDSEGWCRWYCTDDEPSIEQTAIL